MIASRLLGTLNLTPFPPPRSDAIVLSSTCRRDCPNGGSILLREGVYHVTKTLLLDRRVHIFGRGRAVLWGELPADSDFILSTSSSATLDRLRIDDQTRGWSRSLSSPLGLWLQGCDLSSTGKNRGWALVALNPSTLVNVLGCAFRCRAGNGLAYREGACGRVEGCNILGFSGGAGFSLGGASTSPLFSRNTIRDCKVGVSISSNVDPSWSLGEGNVFVNCTTEVYRVPPPLELPPPGPLAPAWLDDSFGCFRGRGCSSGF